MQRFRQSRKYNKKNILCRDSTNQGNKTKRIFYVEIPPIKEIKQKDIITEFPPIKEIIQIGNIDTQRIHQSRKQYKKGISYRFHQSRKSNKKKYHYKNKTFGSLDHMQTEYLNLP